MQVWGIASQVVAVVGQRDCVPTEKLKGNLRSPKRADQMASVSVPNSANCMYTEWLIRRSLLCVGNSWPRSSKPTGYLVCAYYNLCTIYLLLNCVSLKARVSSNGRTKT